LAAGYGGFVAFNANGEASEMAATTTTADIRTAWKFLREIPRHPSKVEERFIGTDSRWNIVDRAETARRRCDIAKSPARPIE
jgi:hypothetical protein